LENRKEKMKKLTNESLTSDLKRQMGVEFATSGVLNKGSEGIMSLNDMVSQLPESEEKEQVIRKPFKKGNSEKLTSKTKMKLPIGKLYSIGKSESKEATGAGAAGQFSQPLFSNESEMTEKWSEKYKRSIDCNNPKGFSQKAHCQGRKKKQTNEEKLKGGKADNKTFEDLVDKNKKNGKKVFEIENMLKKQLSKGMKVEMEHTTDKQKAKEIAMDHLFEDPKYYDKLEKIEGKKTETKEATGASSAGQYSTTAAWAKSTNKKDWRGKSKTQIPGGKFVQVKKKCKKFPYCNQGDINALKIFDHVTVKKVIENLSKKHNISESVIKTILSYEFEQKKNKQ